MIERHALVSWWLHIAFSELSHAWTWFQLAMFSPTILRLGNQASF
jgi:hypothetical protein